MTKTRGVTWDWFSKYVRLKNTDSNGYVRCFTCNTQHIWNSGKIHAGHFLEWDKNRNTRYNIINVQPQCIYCNRMLHGNLKEFRKNLIKKYGIDEINNLYIIAKTSNKIRIFNKKKNCFITKKLPINHKVLIFLKKYYKLKVKILLK